MTTLPDAERLLLELADQMRKDPRPGTALVGIYTGGVWVAERLHRMLALPAPIGTIDVAFWRDDYKKTGMRPGVKPSDIRFEVEGADIILVDDVLYTGRSVRAALDALRDLPAEVREPVRAMLAADGNPDVRAGAEPRPAASQSRREDEETAWRDGLEGRFGAAPDALKRAVTARRGSAPLGELQRLVDRLRAHEHRQPDAGRREEWRAVRGAVHQALASRNSRLAVYDLRDSLLEAERLPVTFLAALEEVGDASCLENLAAAYDASSRSGDRWWREHVATAFRAIVQREGLTRRHAAVKRAMQRWPEATAELMGRT